MRDRLREAAGVDECQRVRAALVEAAIEYGYGRVTLAMVLERSGVDEEAFSRNFDDLEDCLCSVLHIGTEVLMQKVLAAYASDTKWVDRLRTISYALLEFLQEDPDRARIMTVEVLSAGDRAQLVRDQGMQALVEFIDLGRQELPDPDSISRATAEAVGGSIYHQMHTAIERGQLDQGKEMVPQFMYSAVLPYLGPEAAMRELQRKEGD